MEENVKYYTQCNKDIFHAPADLQAQAFDLKAIKNCPKDIAFIKRMDEDLSYEALENACKNYINQNGYEDEIGKGYIFYSCQLAQKAKGVRECELTKDNKVLGCKDTIKDVSDDGRIAEVLLIGGSITRDNKLIDALYEYKYVLGVPCVV